MANADHILTWCENSQPHWRKLTGLKPGNFIRESGLACAAFNLAVEVSHAMIAARDISRSEIAAADILDAAQLMLEWRADA